MVLSIAVRNLYQHKTKTLIIGFLVASGIMMTFAGNAFIDTIIKNISGIFTEYYTGDILITSSETLGAGVFGAQSDDVMGFPVIPVLKDDERALDLLSETDGVDQVTRQLSGYAMFNLGDDGMDYACFFGVDTVSYFDVMNKIELIEGRLLSQSDSGILLHYDLWKKFKETRGIEYKLGDMIQLNNFGTGGMKIREVPLVGIFKFPIGNQRMFAMSFLDDRSLRYLLGKNSGKTEKVEVSEDATAFLEADLDSLFGEDFTVEKVTHGGGAVTSTNMFDILGEKRAVQVEITDPSDLSWHFILARTKEGASTDQLIKKLNKQFDDEGLMLRAQGWEASAMPDSATYFAIKIIFNVAMVLLGFVSIIIIMNTLVVSVMERTSEIGTMRALGAQKSLVTRMFIAETACITVVFGFIGLALGALLILTLNRVGIPTDNDALRYLGGGGILRPMISSSTIIMSFVFMGIIALFSWMYPVYIALKVSPLKAIVSE